MKLPLWLIPVVTIALLFGSWGIGKAMGEWQVTGRQQQSTAGPITADDVRGWMTIQDAADGLGIQPEEIIGLLEVPAGVEVTGQTAFKDLEGLIPGFELTSFREVLKAYLAGGQAPTQPAASSAPPTSQSATATAPKTTGTGIPGGGSGTPGGAGGTPGAGTGTPGAGGGTPTGTGNPGGGSGEAITGQMTLQQVADTYNLDVAELIERAGLPADVDRRTPLRELKNTNPGFEIQAVRDAVAAMTSGG